MYSPLSVLQFMFSTCAPFLCATHFGFLSVLTYYVLTVYVPPFVLLIILLSSFYAP